MVAPGIPSRGRDSYVPILRSCIIAAAAVSGIGAVIALVAGSPLEFGVSTALCAGCLIAVDFIESSIRGRRGARASDSYHVVFVGAPRAARPGSPRTAIRYP
jgi:hypothetical protein